MIYKYEHKKHDRLRSWRRFQEERVVKHRLKNNYKLYGWEYDYFRTGDIEYGRCNWVDLLGERCSQRARTSFSFRKSSWDENEYNRAKYKKHTKRLLWEEGIN